MKERGRNARSCLAAARAFAKSDPLLRESLPKWHRRPASSSASSSCCSPRKAGCQHGCDGRQRCAQARRGEDRARRGEARHAGPRNGASFSTRSTATFAARRDEKPNSRLRVEASDNPNGARGVSSGRSASSSSRWRCGDKDRRSRPARPPLVSGRAPGVRPLDGDAEKWMESNPSAFFEIVRLRQGDAGPRRCGGAGGRVLRRQGIDVGGEYAFDNTLWAGISRYAALFDPSLVATPEYSETATSTATGCCPSAISLGNGREARRKDDSKTARSFLSLSSRTSLSNGPLTSERRISLAAVTVTSAFSNSNSHRPFRNTTGSFSSGLRPMRPPRPSLSAPRASSL